MEAISDAGTGVGAGSAVPQAMASISVMATGTGTTDFIRFDNMDHMCFPPLSKLIAAVSFTLTDGLPHEL